jgi:aerobic C4-dicarboxylate transport protein
LWLQVLVAIVLGVLAGVFFPHQAVSLKPLGDGFVRLIRMTLAPIIFASVVIGIAKMGDLKEVGRVGAKALVYFEVVSSVSLLMGLIAINLLHPGRGMNIDPATLDVQAIASYTASAQHLTLVGFLLNIIPSSIGDAFVSGNILQIILFSVLFGLALSQFRDAARPLVNMLDLFLRGMFGIVRFVMRLAPIGAFGGMAYTIGQYGLRSLKPLALFTAEVWIVSILFVVVVLGVIARAAGFSLFKLLRYFREEILITFGNSAASNPSSAWSCPPVIPSTPVEPPSISAWAQSSSPRPPIRTSVSLTRSWFFSYSCLRPKDRPESPERALSPWLPRWPPCTRSPPRAWFCC